MLSGTQQRRVWEGMLSAEIRSNYFAELSGRYGSKQKLATWATLLFSSGAAISLMARLPDDLQWIRLLCALTATAISIYSVVMQNQKLAVDASDLHARWNRLAKDYQRLWENVYVEDAAERLDALEDRATDLSKAGTIFPNDRRAMLRWEQHVVEHHHLAHA